MRQSEAALPAVTYRDIFRDPRLQRLIDQALANNRDLRQAAANIRAARAQYRIQRADLFPEVVAPAAVHASARASTSVRDDRRHWNRNGHGIPEPARLPTGGGFRDSYSADIGVSAFEIDLFGRVRSLTDAALNRYFATEAAARRPGSTLVADVAEAWLSYAADKSLLKIAQQTAASAGTVGTPDPRAAGRRHRAAHRTAPGRTGAGTGRMPTWPSRPRSSRRT